MALSDHDRRRDHHGVHPLGIAEIPHGLEPHRQGEPGSRNSHQTITRLIQLTFESQVPPLILATAFVIEFSITPASYLGATFQGIQSKLYCVGLLYSLNARTIFAHANGTMVTMDRTDVSHSGVG